MNLGLKTVCALVLVFFLSTCNFPVADQPELSPTVALEPPIAVSPVSETETSLPTVTMTAVATATATATRVPSQTPTKKPTVKPSPTKTLPTVTVVPTKAPDQGYRVPGKSETWLAFGEAGSKMVVNVTAISGGDPKKVLIRIWADDQIGQLNDARSTGAKLPNDKGHIDFNENRGKFNNYDGGTGSAKAAWPAKIANDNLTEITIAFDVVIKPAACAGLKTDTYWEGFWWTTCDQNWLKGNGK